MVERVLQRTRVSSLWFRRDLRLDDNPALHSAIVGVDSFLPVFIFDLAKFNVSTLAGARKSSARRARFLLESVACLRSQLEKRGSGLAVFVGSAGDILSRVCPAAATVCVTRGACSEEIAEEEKVAKQLRNIKFKKDWGSTLYLPEECGCTPTQAPLLFSTFRERAERGGRIRKPLESPRSLPPLYRPEDVRLRQELEHAFQFMPCLEDLGYEPDEVEQSCGDDLRGVLPFEGGEVAGLQRIQNWMFDGDHLKNYFRTRNGMLGEAYSSKFSPWLALGCISARRIWQEVQRYESQRTKNKSTYWLIFELIWRDFFFYMALSQGDKLCKPGGVIGDRTPWHGSEKDLAKWKDGRTGDRLVDANMRELKATGFMSNRGRQNVASYLIFDLGVDWRYGAAHFEELLLDHDPCSNWGNWVAAAGLTGQRINRFNTRKQLSDYDPGCEYVDCWLRSDPQIRKRKREPDGKTSVESISKKTKQLSHRPLESGMKVKLVDLQQGSHMNGSVGVLGKFCEQRGHWQVFVENVSKAKAVEPHNLEELLPEQMMGA